MVTEKKKQKSKRPGPRFIVDAKGRPTEVVLSIEDYEDLHDRKVMDERETEPTVPWEDVKKRLRADGLLPD